MALGTKKIKLPTSVVVDIINKAKDVSTIAALSTPQPQLFANSEHMIFSGKSEAEVVEEGAKKGSYEQTLASATGKRVKLVTTTRVTDELRWADEDNRLEIIKYIMQDQLEALGRALDYVIYHAVSPKSGAVLEDYTALTAGASKVVSTEDEVANLDAMADALMEYDINGIALSRPFASSLRKLRVPATGLRLYPEIPISLKVGNLDGIPSCTSGTVNGKLCSNPTKVRAIMGDFDTIKWGMVREAWAEPIEYGDPDNSGVDLKGSNQIAFRTESVFSYALLDPAAFCVLTEAE